MLGSTCAPRGRNFAFPQSERSPPQDRSVFSCVCDTKILFREDLEALPTWVLETGERGTDAPHLQAGRNPTGISSPGAP